MIYSLPYLYRIKMHHDISGLAVDLIKAICPGSQPETHPAVLKKRKSSDIHFLSVQVYRKPVEGICCLVETIQNRYSPVGKCPYLVCFVSIDHGDIAVRGREIKRIKTGGP